MGISGTLDLIMDKQSAYFATSQLTRAYDLAGPQAPTSLHLRNQENSVALGGMRRPDLSVRSNPLYRSIGAKLHIMASDFIKDFPSSLNVIRGLRAGDEVSGFSDKILSDFRSLWFSVLGSSETPKPLGPDAAALQAWGEAVNDPDLAHVLPHWLRHGAPIGILEPIEVTGVFPAVTPGELRDPYSIYSELAGWSNYSSAEDEIGIVNELLEAQEAKKHCKFFDTMDELCDYLGVDDVILTKLALISKQKPDKSWKHRLIWDLLRSDVNAAVELKERIVLPRIQDAVEDALELRKSGGQLEWMVLDISDAFHNVPMRPSERRFSCGKVGDRYVVFEVLCMGGKSAPNVWGRYAAGLGRITASVFDPSEFRDEIYVDDPLMAAVGTEEDRDITFTIALLVLQTTGFPLAWSKGVVGTQVTWIGAQLTVLPFSIEVSVPEDKLDTLQALTTDIGKSVVAGRRLIRSYCGKLSFVAGMVPIIRPFLSMLWGALSSKAPKLPGGLIHTRQLKVAIDWMHALLQGRHGPLVRDFPLQVQMADEGDFIATDACPWGYAGVKFERHHPVAWFATPLTTDDLRRFHASRGESRHNTTWEALALLVAIRLWLPGTTVTARVRSDSLSALRSMVKLASKSADLNLIARELALDSVHGLYTIGMATHIPGVSNILPDDLSRMWAPDPHAFPKALVGIPEHIAPPRDRTFWRTTTGLHRRGMAASKRRTK